MLQRIAGGGVLLMLILAHMACTKDSPTKPAFTPESGFWSTELNFREGWPEVNFRLSDDGSAIEDFMAFCQDNSDENLFHAVEPVRTIPLSGTKFTAKISVEDTWPAGIEPAYETIKISGSFSSPEEANVRVEWGDAYRCSQAVKLNRSCDYTVARDNGVVVSESISCVKGEELQKRIRIKE